MQLSVPWINELKTCINIIVIVCWHFFSIIIKSLFPFKLRILLSIWWCLRLFKYFVFFNFFILSIFIECPHYITKFLEIKWEYMQMKNYFKQGKFTCFDISKWSCFWFTWHVNWPFCIMKKFVEFTIVFWFIYEFINKELCKVWIMDCYNICNYFRIPGWRVIIYFLLFNLYRLIYNYFWYWGSKPYSWDWTSNNFG